MTSPHCKPKNSTSIERHQQRHHHHVAPASVITPRKSAATTTTTVATANRFCSTRTHSMPNPNKLNSSQDYNWSRLLSSPSIKAKRAADALKSMVTTTTNDAPHASGPHGQHDRHRQATASTSSLLSAPSSSSQSSRQPEPDEPQPLQRQRRQQQQQQQLDNWQLFDPVRTLQFLINELKSRLSGLLPDDQFVHGTLADIDRTMVRLINSPPQGAEMARDDKAAAHHQYRELLAEHEILLTQSKQLTENGRDLQTACDALQAENARLELELGRCKEQTVVVTRDMAALERKLETGDDERQAIIVDLRLQCERLQSELRALHDADSQRHMAECRHELLADQLAALNAKLEQSSDTIATLDRSRRADSAQLVSAALEKEKLSILLKCREKQMQEIGKELADIHKLAQRQIDVLNGRMLSGSRISERISGAPLSMAANSTTTTTTAARMARADSSLSTLNVSTETTTTTVIISGTGSSGSSRSSMTPHDGGGDSTGQV